MVSAVIVAAGRSTRMGRDKLFLPLRGHPLIAYTLRRFECCAVVRELVVVTRASVLGDMERVVRDYGIGKAGRIVEGGAERQDSVWNGLQAVGAGTEIVLIHDGARPCITAEAIERTTDAARRFGAAVVATKVTDTLKEAREDGTVVRTVDRSRLWAVQTPQGFRLEMIRAGYAEVQRRGMVVTDDTAAVELIGQTVHLVENAAPNWKVTGPQDVALAEWFLRDVELTPVPPLA